MTRGLTLFTVLAVLLGMVGQYAWASPSTGDPAVPHQRTGSAAGLGHRSASAVKRTRGGHPAVAPRGAAAKSSPRVAPRTLQLSNVPQIRATAQKPSRGRGVFEPQARGKEDLGKRTANGTVFDNPNGSYTARVYSQPVHYRDSTGAWQNIDTTLVRQPGGGWQEKANSSTPVFAAEGDDSALMSSTLGKDESIAFSLQGAAATPPTVSGNEITYQDILPGAALTYAANAAGVKETLVLDNASAPTTWTFPLALTGLTASLDHDGGVVLTNAAGDTVLTIPHGFMRDSNIDPRSNDGAQSNGVTYSLTTVDGRQALRVDLDPTWVHDPARVFPIKVDPTNINITASTYVMSQFTNDYSTDSVLKAGTYDGGTHVANSYILFHSFGTTFANDFIEAATLNLDTIHSWSCSARPVSVSPITSTWSPAGLKSYPAVSYGAAIGTSSFAAGYTGCGAEWESIDIGDNPSAAGTKLVEQWAHGGSNLGLAITASRTDDFGYKEFDSVNSSFPPYLSVTYSPNGAVYAPSKTYTQPSATVAGSQQVTITNRGRTAWSAAGNSIGYQLYSSSGALLSSGATRTAMPGAVAPNASTTVTAKIGAVAPGQYTLCWDMYAGTTSFNTANGVPTYCETMDSANTPPQIDSQHPLSNTVLGSLTPSLQTSGHDPDNFPNSGLKYDFRVYTAPSDGSAPVLVVESGWQATGVTTWAVPKGKLSWNQPYLWEVADNDTLGSSAWSGADYFTTAVPQPLITSHLGAANSSGRSFDPGVGDYTTSATDAKVSVAGPALSIVRSYNSQDPRTGNLFGAGWSTVYDMSAVPDSDGSGNVVVTYPDGHTVRFGLNADGTTYTPPQGTYATFQGLAGGGYSLTDRGGTTYTLTTAAGAGWKLTAITDADQRSETLSYVGGQLTTITNTASDRSLHLTWSGGHPASVATDPVTAGGQPVTWTYGYSGSTLTSVCPPTSPTQCVSYTYTAGTGSGSHYRSTVLDAQPTAYWRLNDQAGSLTAADEVAANVGSDNGTYGTTFGHGQGPLPGSPAKGAFFGANSGVTLPANLVASTYDTVQLWFQTPAGGPAGVLLSTDTSPLGAANANTNAMPLLYVGTNGKLYGQWWTSSVAPIVSTNAVNDGSWHQVTLVGAGVTQSMYLDGALVGTRAGTIKNVGPSEIVGAGYVNGNAWVSGPGTGWSYFDGNLAEVAFYAHPLGAPAIAQQYAAGSQPAVELTSVTTPNGNVAAQASYDNVTDRATQIVDQHGGTWQLHAPTTSGSSTVYRGAVRGSDPRDFWPLSESSGAQAVNQVSGPGTDGDADYANVTLGQPGPLVGAPDTSASFSATASSSLHLPRGFLGAAPTQTNVGVALWFKTTTTGGVLFSYQFGLATQALDGVLPEVAVSGLAGAAGGAAAGATTSAAMYGLTCGSTRSGCSVSGLASAAGGGAAVGAVAGAGTGVKGAMADAGEGAPAQPRAGEDDAAGCVAGPHSFIGSTRVLLADGKTKPISQVKVGDKVADAVPGSARTETHPVSRVIVTKTDHDFVRLSVKRLGKAAAGVAVAVAATTALAAPAQAATVTTTYHHPFYDVTQSAFVDADHLKAGDLLQSTDDGRAQITSTQRFHAATTTYDLTIDGLHTYDVLAGGSPVLVHNCGNDSDMGPGPWDLRGKDPMRVVPGDAQIRELTPDPDGGAQYGLEFKWTDSQGRTVRLRAHGPDGTAPEGSNAASGETYRIQIAGRYQDESGNLLHKNMHNPNSPYYDPEGANDTHITWPDDVPGL